jgi:hypothetical protein
MLTLHPSSAIEYWFFKVNSDSIALIVDWIERRKLNEHVLRVSVHSPHKREVIFEKLDSFMPSDNFLSQKKTVGHCGDVSWDLDIELGSETIKPDIFPARLFKMPDTLYKSSPLAKFTGWIRHGNEQVTVDQVCGAVTLYWGRQLIQEWWWMSAHQFDQENVAMECSVLRTSLWGTALQMPLAFLYLYRNGKRDFLMAPPNSVDVKGSPDNFSVEFSGIGRKKIKLICTGREYADFGERIINTLTGDLDIFENNQLIASAKGTAGLERRTPQQTAD